MIRIYITLKLSSLPVVALRATPGSSPTRLHAPSLDAPLNGQTIQEFDHFDMSNGFLSVRSGSSHLGHPKWLSKPYMNLTISVCQLASCLLDRDQSILGIADSCPNHHIGNAFGSTSVERERIYAHRKRVWIDEDRARAHLSSSETHLDRQASSESASEHRKHRLNHSRF